ncbi:hypothetical protein [Pseudorhizobium pelagicum]|uniref:Uncharacterized protein n=1 Tax=Pseudorhizobium pelagicum TaxID=1509405 RepID=A0A922NXH4_9HYPH|nr:hypothetical protein [Pseudorhizobium pelagicum]KEQ02981.1 hypothetical protein GV68_18110 [Pseudorhizobium pelagicum]KEQ08351.1 hypothetical protein GV67_14480 [Pseudorhizobium pelagicum]
MNDQPHSKRSSESKKPVPEDEAAVSGNPPVQPVENFDLGEADDDRRMFQNGDTDRTADKNSKK